MLYLGDFPINHTSVVIPFNAFTSNDPSASATITDFANTDVHIHKNGSLTQRASSAGVAIDIDVDAITGGHWITIDLSDNTDAGFYVAGSEISVRIEGVTIDGATVNAFVGSFSIERAGGVLAILKAGTVDVNTKTITAGAITATAIADAAIDNATFAADVGSTAHGTNIIALAVRKILEELNLDHLLKVTTGVAADDDLEDYVVAGTVMAHALATGADMTTFKPSTDSLQSIRDHADTIKAETALIVEDTNELQTDNIPGTLATIAGYIDTEIGTLQTAVDAVKAETVEILTDTAVIGAAGVGLTEAGGDGDHLTQVVITQAAADLVWGTAVRVLTAGTNLENISLADILGMAVDDDGTAISLGGFCKLVLAILSGKSSGGGTATIVFRDIADSKNRISATVDANGNRTAVGTRDAT